MIRRVLLCAAVLGLAGCSSEPPKPAGPKAAPKAEAKPTETQTGRAAFYKLYSAARQWAADARPVRLESVPTTDGNGMDGTSAVWRGLLASPARRGIRPMTWSGSNAPGAPERGVYQAPEDSFNPSNASTQPFDMAFLKVDSDAAFQTAQKHGGDKLLKKDAATPVCYLLDWDPRKNQLGWHVIYGSSRSDAKLVVDVDATLGDYIRTEK